MLIGTCINKSYHQFLIRLSSTIYIVMLNVSIESNYSIIIIVKYNYNYEYYLKIIDLGLG